MLNKPDLKKIFENKPVLLKTICAVIFLCVFVKLTFMPAFNEPSFYDTGYAWFLSKIMNFENFVEILRAEGHFIVWYLIIMPFAKLNLFYPYSIQTINWLICFAALVYLWRKSPFDAVINAVITLSFVMTQYFAIIARCYSAGVLGLFIVASLYKKSIEKPVLYSIAIALTLNTSVFAAVPCVAFLSVFIGDIYKEKLFKSREIIASLCISAASLGFAIFPFLTGKPHFVPPLNLSEIICVEPEMIYLVPILTFLIVSAFILFNDGNKKIKFVYLFSTCIAALFLLFLYKGELYHRFFFIIYAIIALWAQETLIVSRKTIIPYAAFIILLLFGFNLEGVHVTELYKTFGLELQKSGNSFENSVIIVPDKDFRYTLLPYTANNGKITVYEPENKYPMSLDLDFNDKKTLDAVSDFVKKSDKPVYLFSFKEIRDAQLIRKTEEDYYENSKLYIYKLNAE